MLNGSYEEPVQRCMAELIGTGDVVVDVGANEGFFTLLAAHLVGRAGRVLAFEPSARNLRRLRRNISLNGSTRVEVCPVALSREWGPDRLLLTRYGGGPTLASTGIHPPDVLRTRRIVTDRLDHQLETRQLTADFVKIDVEGAERMVLEGMTSILRQQRPLVLVEVDGPRGRSHGERWQHVDELLRSARYQVEHLASSYGTTGSWAVGHSLARPTERS